MRDEPSFEQEVEWLKESIRGRYRPPTTARPIRLSVAEWLTRQRIASPQLTKALRAAWRKAAGEMIAEHSLPTRVSRGVLQVIVADSMVAQEIALHRNQILATLQKLLPDQPIRKMRCKVGVLSD